MTNHIILVTKYRVSVLLVLAEPHSSVGSFADLRTGGRRFDSRLGQNTFQGLIIVIATGLFLQWLCGKAASGLERISC